MKNLSLQPHLESPKWPKTLLKDSNIDLLCLAIVEYSSFLYGPKLSKNCKNLSLNANLVLVDNAYNQHLNTVFLQKEKTTNVLAFPLYTFDSTDTLHIGDIYIAYETVEKEAKEQNKTLLNHLIHLIIHGTLHLLGYDHQNETEAFLMESSEISILNSRNIPNPYIYEV